MYCGGREKSEYLGDETARTSDDYESIVLDHDPQKEMIVDALNEVKNYIIKHKLILSGGMSIDAALRAKGSSLYKDNKLPDYDFYSSEFHKDAYNIGNILAEKYTGVGVINATHVSTLRVRINFIPVADCTYVPANVLKNIPTIGDKLRFVHPYYQMIDQHRALSMPFENAPKESFFNRWKKDMQRYDMLNNCYPMKLPKINIKKLKSIKYTVNFDTLDGECITGYAGLLYWLQQATDDGFTTKTVNAFKPIKITTDDIIVELPDPAYFSILTDNFEELFKRFEGKKTFYNELIDKIPRKILIESKKTKHMYEILDNRGSLRTAYKPFLAKRLWISNLQGIMCYLLTLGVFYKSPLAQYAYHLAQEILFWAATKFSEENGLSTHSGKTGHNKYHRYLPSVETYGQYNYGHSYTSSKQRELVYLGEIPDPQNKPRMSYPEKNKPVNSKFYDFDPTKSEFYQIDGCETTKFEMSKY
jgi:Poly(A) polymerase catalytic subunit